MRKYFLAGMTLLILSCATLSRNKPDSLQAETDLTLLSSATIPPANTPTPSASPTPNAPPTLAVSNYQNVSPDYNWEVDSASKISGISISPDKEHVAVFTLRPPEQWWLEMRDTKTGELFWDVNVGIAKYNALAFSPDSTIIATGTGDGLVRTWDVKSGELVRTYEGHTQPSRFIVFSADATMIASGGSDSTARIWDVSTGQRLKIYQINTNARDIAFSPDSQYLAVTTHYINVYSIFADEDEEELQVYKDSEGDTKDLGEVAFSPNGSLLLASGFRRNLQLNNKWEYRLLAWDFPNNEWQPHTIKLDDTVEDVVIAPDNKVMICLYKDRGRLVLINIEDGKVTGDVNIGSKLYLAYSADISTFAVVSTKTKVTIWNVPK